MFDVLILGSATRDVFMGAENLKKIKGSEFLTGEALALSLGSKFEINKIIFTTGGGGANAAATFGSQGLKTACVGVVGDDFNGKEILSSLEKYGVDVSGFVIHDDDFTAYSVILVDKSGERTILSYKGEGQHFDANKVDLDKFQTKWMYLDSLGGHYDMLEKAVNWAVKNNVKLATNPGGKELAHGLEKLKPLLKNFSIVAMNREEAAGLTGIDFKDENKIFKTMDEIIGGIFVMTDGPNGVKVSDGKNVYSAGVPSSPVVERTGAGDAFNSGFVTEYIRSGDITKAIQFATANASSVVTQYGATEGVLKKDDWGKWPLVEVTVGPFEK